MRRTLPRWLYTWFAVWTFVIKASTRAFLATFALTLALAFAHSVAFSQERASTPASPPKLKRFVAATYPDQARDAGTQGHVEFVLTIDAEGRVKEAQVLNASDAIFIEPALTAVRQFEFEPASREGTPVAARIRYRYVFETQTTVTIKTETVVEKPPAIAAPAATAEEGFVAIARVAAPPREVTRRTIEREELTRVAGTRGDPLRTIEILPGVGRMPFSLGFILIRGGSPQDSEVFFDGVPLPSLYHFAGLTGTAPAQVIDSIDFVPGNFSPRYGRKMGGIIEVHGRDPGEEGFRGRADINLIDASLFIETPISDKVSIAMGVRRSYIDFFFDKVVPSDSFSTIAAPVYYDYQAITSIKLSSRERFRLSWYGSSDTLRLFLNNPSDTDPQIRGNFDVLTRFHQLQALWRKEISPEVHQDIDLAVGIRDLRFGLGDSQKFEGRYYPIIGRAEWRIRSNPKLQWITGLDLQVIPARIDYTGVAPGQSEGDPSADIGSGSPLSSDETVNYTSGGTLTVFRPAVYLESDIEASKGWHLIPGLRFDWYSEIKSWSLNPRLVSRYQLTEKVLLKGGAGLFSQPPEFQESVERLGNPNLKPMHALHLSFGSEYTPFFGTSLGAEVFYKRLFNRVVAVPGLLDPRFTNDGVGNIYGVELSAKAAPSPRTFGYLSYTLMRSERKDLDNTWRLFDYDQTHILTAAGVYRLGAGWEVGATFRLVSGKPYTPIIGSSYDANHDVYQPLYGSINTARNPLFHRLDVRVEKQWRFSAWRMALYLDVQNIYSRMNQEGVAYNYDYTRTQRIGGLPIIPSLGIRGEVP